MKEKQMDLNGMKIDEQISNNNIETDGEYPWSPMGPTHPFNEDCVAQNGTHYNGSDALFVRT